MIRGHSTATPYRRTMKKFAENESINKIEFFFFLPKRCFILLTLVSLNIQSEAVLVSDMFVKVKMTIYIHSQVLCNCYRLDLSSKHCRTW